ncbi:MAG: hypothetical protein ACI9F9_000456, partial [Candidatus Paceibacteria bacterium]
TATATATATVTATASQELPYAELADRFLESKGKANAGPSQTTPSAILDEDFLKAEVGLFDIWIPADELGEKQVAKDYRTLCAALCAAQTEWVSWLGDGAIEGERLLEDMQLAQQWIEGWDLADLQATQSSGERSVSVMFEPKEKIAAALGRCADSLRQNKVLGSEQESPSRPVKLVLMPSRKGFVEFIAYAGQHYERDRGNFWLPSIQNWSQFDLADMRVIALEYASPAARPGSYTESYSMRSKSPTGMEEQVVQLGLNELLAHQHGDALPPSLISGLSINLVTRIYKACHSRIDGDTRGKVTAKREVFVRGGRPEGGILPPNSAESRWRQNYGKNYYGPILKQAQKAGATEAKHRRLKDAKLNSFMLVRESGMPEYLTQAPLLGASGGPVEVVPDVVYGDYLEFTRAYRSAFLYWLQNHGERSKKKAAKSFGELLCRLSGDAQEKGLAAIAEEIYGAPLSDPTASKKSLEGRFLKWITKQ